MSLQDVTNKFSALSILLRTAVDTEDAPLAFEAAPEPVIETGDVVLTVWGWWGKVTFVGTDRYYLVQLYKMASGTLIEPDRKYRVYAFDAEIVSVLS